MLHFQITMIVSFVLMNEIILAFRIISMKKNYLYEEVRIEIFKKKKYGSTTLAIKTLTENKK